MCVEPSIARCRIGELIVVEDIERLSREYQGKALGKLDLLFERDIDLPRQRGGDDVATRDSKYSPSVSALLRHYKRVPLFRVGFRGVGSDRRKV